MKHKKIISIALALVMLAVMLPMFSVVVFAESSVTCGDNLTWLLDDSGTLTISGTGNMADYENVGDVPWYSYLSLIKSVVIKKGVTSIGDCAFQECINLESITIPDSVTSIGRGAFYYCSSLKSITIPDSITSIGRLAFGETGYYNTDSNWKNDVLYIGNYLIVAKEKISGNIEIKNGTKLIADYAVYGCSSLESITIPDSVTNIGESAFEETGYYNTDSNWKNDVLYIGNYLIAAKEKISGNIEIENGTKLIAGGAFSRCEFLTSIKIPDTVTNIGSRLFYRCSELTSIEIPDCVTSIGESAFYGCGFSSITLPKGITTISDKTFMYCDKLKSVDIPNGVTSIGSDAFYRCDSLNCINYDGTKKEWKAITIDSTNELTNVEINYLREPETTTTVSENIFTVTGKNIDGCTVILALYKDDGQGNNQLAECQTVKYSGSEKTFTTTATGYTSAKVMVWKDLETLEPVCEAYEMKFQ